MRNLLFTMLCAAGLNAQTMEPGATARSLSAFRPAPMGCAMAHCDVRMSDIVQMFPPTSAAVSIRSHDPVPAAGGGACSSNARMVVCSYGNQGRKDNIVAYNGDGARLWTSGFLLGSYAYTSAPMVNTAGSVIVADGSRVVRFRANGGVLWNTPTPGGIPISPVVTESGTIVLATRFGPVSAFDSIDGRLVGSLYIRENPSDPDFFDTVNTPCVRGNRVYISTERRNDPARTGWLVALDVDPSNPAEPLRLAWHFTFGGPSGTSPLCVGNTVIFDGDRLNPGEPKNPRWFAVRDEGPVGIMVWTQPVANSIVTSPAQDLRDGFWGYVAGGASLQRRSFQTGSIIESINVSDLVNDPNPNLPYSAMTMAGSPTRPILIVGTTDDRLLTSYVIAVDLTTRTLLWKVNIKPTLGAELATGQFPIVIDSSGKPVVAFATRNSGAYFIAEP